MRGGGKSEEETSTKEVQDKHLTSLLHKIDEYKRKIQSCDNFENKLETYIKPLGKLNQHEDSVREPFELELEVKKILLSSDSSTEPQVLLLTGEAGIGKSSFCKYLQRAMLLDWDESEWLPILVDLSNLKEATNFTISETLKQELSLTKNEIE